MGFFDDIKANLTPEEIIDIVTNTLGAHTYQEHSDCIIFPTICHNIDSENARMKLYYYKENRLFHCYTECSSSFDIFGLFKKYYQKNNQKYDFYKDILLKIVSKESLSFEADNYKYQIQRDKYKIKKRDITLISFPKNIINIYQKLYPVEWTYENISDKTMDRFNIRFSPLENKIIIPHYDINDNLIGIRARALNEEDIQNFGKYAPVKIEDKWYSHPLSLNLYGINFNKEAIKRARHIVIAEGEKSVLLYDEFFGSENNISVAVCGSSFNKLQLQLLLKNFDLNEIIIAFDKEYNYYPSKESENYFNRLLKLCEKYSKYCNFSFLFDTKNLLREKESPFDRGKKVFENLLENRVKIKNT